MIVVLPPFGQLFAERGWGHVQVLVLGALLAAGKRTVSSCLRVRGWAWEEHFTHYHRVLNRAQGSALQASKMLLGLLGQVGVPPGGTLGLGADDRVERRSGRQLKAKGGYRAAVRSSRQHVVKCFGLKGGALRLRVAVPWAPRVWALPFLTGRCWPPKSRAQRRHKTRVDWGRQLGKQTRRWLPGRLLVQVGEGGFAAVALAQACVASQVTRGSRLRVEAARSPPPVPPPPGNPGRKPAKGPRQRTLKVWAARADTPWQETLVDWYRGERQRLWVFSRTALWYTPGLAPVASRLVLVRDPEGQLSDAAFCCPDVHATPEQILPGVVRRWAGEGTFAEARPPLGLATQRQGADKAMARTTPGLLGLCSLVTGLAWRFCPSGPLPVEGAAWYHKSEAPFAAC